MTPSFSYRIDSMIQAVTDIVIPAIRQEESLAMEQIQLVVAHLTLMKTQLPMAEEFDKLELAEAVELAGQLINLSSENDVRLDAATEHLQMILANVEEQEHRQLAIRHVNSSLEELFRDIRSFASRGTIDAATTLVMAYGKRRAYVNRIWFASNGFDADTENLPPLASIFQK